MRYLAATSPSVALERGIGRLRAPVRRRHEPSPSPSPPSRRRSKQPPQQLAALSIPARSRNVTLLFIGVATVAIFIILAFLLGRSWRWETSNTLFWLSFFQFPDTQHRHPSESSSHDPLSLSSPSSPHVAILTRITSPSQTVSYTPALTDRYLTWLPHSGFHNQRVSLENALIMARMLNRTLIIPPIRLGKVIRYGDFDKLHRHIALSTKIGLEHCAYATIRTSFTPRECIGYSEYTMIPWSALIDMHAVSHIVPIIERWDSSSAWLRRYLNVSRSETVYVKDSQPYQYQIYDDHTNKRPLKPKYVERLDVQEIYAHYNEFKLLHFGSLFGTSRLRLKKLSNQQTRREVRERMVFANSVLFEISRAISEDLGGSDYHGLHIRLADGEFLMSGNANVRVIWWSLVTGLMGMSMNEAHEIEARAMGWSELPTSEWPAPPPNLIQPSADPSLVWNNFAAHNSSNSSPSPRKPSPSCRQTSDHTISNATQLNFPVFIATDAPSPRSNPSLQLFLRTLPCSFFLSDFDGVGSHLSALDSVINDDDGLPLKTFLLPFVDSMVAAMANRVIGTPHSTFSRFTVDVMNRMYHGLPIIERGR